MTPSLEVVQGKALVVRSAISGHLLQVVPNAALVEHDRVVMPWTQHNAQLLGSLRLPTVSPIIRDYDFSMPTGDTPFPHQYRGASFLTAHQRGFLLAEPGTGKSYMGVWAIDYLQRVMGWGKALIVSPLSTLNAVWLEHVYKVNMQAKVAVLHGSMNLRRDLMRADATIHIINYEALALLHNELLAQRYPIVLFDEGTYLKTYDTHRAQSAKALSAQARWVWDFTGTPTPQSPMDAYGQARVVLLKDGPKSKQAFRDSVMVQVSSHKWVPRAAAAEVVAATLQPGLVIKKRDVLAYLPPVTRQYLDVPLSPEQKQALARLRKDMRITTDDGREVTAVHAAALLIKLCQIASGSVRDEAGVAVDFDVAPRMAELDRVLSGRKGKALIFVPFRHSARRVQAHLGPRFSLIHGDVTPLARRDIFHQLQKGELEGIVAIPRTMSHGITLTAADTVVWWAPCTSSDTYQQACERTDRPGQVNPVNIFHFSGGPIEHDIYLALQAKASQQASAMALIKRFLHT